MEKIWNTQKGAAIRKLLWVSLSIIGCLFWIPPEAQAQDKQQSYGDRILVVQRKPFLRKHRVETAPTFHSSFNDSLVQQVGAGLDLYYHINESFFAGISGTWQDWRFVSSDATGFTKTYERVIDATDSIPEASVINAYIGADFGYVPVYGKMNIFNAAIIPWDIHLKAGGGGVHTRSNGFVGGGSVALGQRFFLLDWMSLNIEARGIFYSEDLGKGSAFYQQWQAGIGLAIWGPFSFQYTPEDDEE